MAQQVVMLSTFHDHPRDCKSSSLHKTTSNFQSSIHGLVHLRFHPVLSFGACQAPGRLTRPSRPSHVRPSVRTPLGSCRGSAKAKPVGRRSSTKLKRFSGGSFWRHGKRQARGRARVRQARREGAGLEGSAWSWSVFGPRR